MRPRVQSAFTLVELLVVLAVIALLAAILMPVLARARDRALQTDCLSNEKQIGAAMAIYRNDWDDGYPPPLGHLSPTQRYTPDWRKALAPYVAGPGIFICPTNTVTGPIISDPPPGVRLRLPLFATCYGMNGVAFGYEDPQWQLYGGMSAGRDATDVRQPSTTILVGESRNVALPVVVPDGASAKYFSYSPGKAEAVGLAPGELDIHTHDGRVNWLFCDGHARALKVAQTLEPLDLWSAGGPSTPDPGGERQAFYQNIIDTLGSEYR